MIVTTGDVERGVLHVDDEVFQKYLTVNKANFLVFLEGLNAIKSPSCNEDIYFEIFDSK